MATFALTMIVSNDLVRSRDFYRDVVGLTVGVDQPPHWVDFQLGNGMMLGIHPADERLHVIPGSTYTGFSVEDVDAFIAGLKGRDVPIIQEPRDEPFGRLALIRDPDGYTVQIYTPVQS